MPSKKNRIPLNTPEELMQAIERIEQYRKEQDDKSLPDLLQRR